LVEPLWFKKTASVEDLPSTYFILNAETLETGTVRNPVVLSSDLSDKREL